MAKIETRIVLRSNKDESSLEKCTFYIKDYQRGYRWEEQQIKSLLNDLYEFDHVGHTVKYCMQPLVVKKFEGDTQNHARELCDFLSSDGVWDGAEETAGYDAWELIDGQQRLTTTLLILNSCYGIFTDPPKLPYKIYYELIRNIDEYYICRAKTVVDKWFNDFGAKKNDVRNEISGKIHSDIQFIWYEVDEDVNSAEIFTKLNVGKIPLTNAELFKAQLLNTDRIDLTKEENALKDSIALAQIAFEWDKIEQSLRDNEFWSFISNEIRDGETRIDYLLRLYAIQLKNEGQIDNTIQEADSLFPFLAINNYISKKKEDASLISYVDWNKKIWKEIVTIHDKLKSWYSNNRIFHYIGFLIATSKSSIQVITELVKDTDKKKKSEIEIIVLDKIHQQTKNITLEKLSYPKDRAKIRNVLLFFNLATMVQSKTDNRFSFKQYKDPKAHWDIEHIHARATDEEIRAITDPGTRRAFLEELRKQFMEINDNDTVQEIDDFITSKVMPDSINEDEFLEFCCNVTEKYGEFNEDGIGNLTLLDAETNRSYQNALFPVKRKIIIEKDKGEVFIPVCTKNVFLKMYSSNLSNMLGWTRDDAADYLAEMEKTLVKEGIVCR